jgi:ribose transport system substrate-binding protein
MRRQASFGAVLTAAVAALMASGCSSSAHTAAAQAKTRDYYIAYGELSTEGGTFAEVNQGVQNAAATLKYQLKPYDNNFDVNTTQQNAQLIAASNPDAVIEESPSQSIGASLSRTFGKTPCIAMVTTIPGCSTFQLPSQALSQSLAGVIAQLMRNRGWNSSNTTVILLQNASAGPSVNYFPHQFYGDLAQLVPGLSAPPSGGITPQTTKIGANGLQVDSQGTLDGGYQAVASALQALPASRHLIVVGVEDDPVLGALRAIAGADRGSNAMLAGYGGSSDGLSQLRTNPAWVAEADIAPDAWGEYLLAMVTSIERGAKLPAVTYAPGWIVTKGNVSKYFAAGSDAASVLPPLAPQDQYLAKTGVLQHFANSPVK